MVSFSCEACGDTLTKKKLDAHRGQCRGASFTCLDCMVHFQGISYKSHTSCISEDQKYQGALYREKPAKKSNKSTAEARAPRNAYVEDASDADTGNAISIVEAPPEAPDPPPAAPTQPNVNVFDFLVTEDTPNASRISLAPSESKSLDYTPSILSSEVTRKQTIAEHDPEYEVNGFSYGNDPIPTAQRKERPKVEYITPAGKDLHRHLTAMDDKEIHHNKSKDKKRKRLHVEELDLTAARRPSQEPDDTIMSDAPAPVLHSGLTGGLNRLLSKSNKFPPSPDYSNDPPSPVKRSKSTSRTLVVKRRIPSSSSSTAVVKVSKRRPSDESRPRKKKHRTHGHHEESQHHNHHKQKAAAYQSQTDVNLQQQLVVFKSRAELLLSFITKGEESQRGVSMHKALKRYHRERGRASGREEEEKELWKGLRMRRNERGEVVVFLDE